MVRFKKKMFVSQQMLLRNAIIFELLREKRNKRKMAERNVFFC